MRALRFLALSITVFLAATTAGAQTAEVYSGEHGSFTRIAIVFPEETTWRTEDVEDGFRVVFTPRPSPFDLGEVFDRIDRSRIGAISQDPEDGSLLLESSCACALDVFLAGDRVIALDMREEAGQTPEASVAEAERTPDAGLRLPLPVRRAGTVPPAPSDGGAGALLAPGPIPPSETSAVEPPGLDEGLLAEPGGTAAGPIGAPAPSASTALREALVAGLTSAAEAGLVDLARDTALPAPGAPPDGAVPDMAESSSTDANMDIRTAYEAFLALEAGHRDGAFRACPTEGTFAFLETAGSDPGLPSLQLARQAFLSERDQPAPEGARALVRRYLSLGMGAEAAAILPHAGLAEDEAMRHRSLARIVDHTFDDAAEVWAGWTACEGRAALWALLGHPPDAHRGPVAVEPIQRAFFALPAHLRKHLGREVAARLLELAHPAAASAIERNVAQLLTRTPPAAQQDGPAQGAAQPRAGQAEETVRDLLDLLQTDMDRGQRLDPLDLASAEALAWEYRGTEEGIRLRDATVLGRLERGDVGGAVDLLEDGAFNASTDAGWNASLRQGVGTAIASAADAQLLAIMLHPQRETLTALLSPPQRLSIAERLIELGFPQSARSLLPAGSQAATGEERRILAAAFHAEGDSRRSLAMIAGQRTPAAARLRGEARYALGDFASAAPDFGTAGDGTLAAHAAWRSGDRAQIGTYGTAEQKALIESLDAADGTDDGTAPAPEGALSEESAPALERTRRLVERSAGLRSAVAEILEGAPDSR